MLPEQPKEHKVFTRPQLEPGFPERKRGGSFLLKKDSVFGRFFSISIPNKRYKGLLCI